MVDSEPSTIPKELLQRDQFGNSDWFDVFLDTYRDGINGFGFIVTLANVQFDAKYSVFGEDPNWDAVWESAVQITPGRLDGGAQNPLFCHPVSRKTGTIVAH